MSKSAHIIDEIERVRAKNNVNWMNILRLAFECDPVKAKAIVKDIKRDDEKIGGLLDELVGE